MAAAIVVLLIIRLLFFLLLLIITTALLFSHNNLFLHTLQTLLEFILEASQVEDSAVARSTIAIVITRSILSYIDHSLTLSLSKVVELSWRTMPSEDLLFLNNMGRKIKTFVPIIVSPFPFPFPSLAAVPETC